jgi:hypothetical protein
MMLHEMRRSLKARRETYFLKKEPPPTFPPLDLPIQDKILLVCIILFFCVACVLFQDFIGLISL